MGIGFLFLFGDICVRPVMFLSREELEQRVIQLENENKILRKESKELRNENKDLRDQLNKLVDAFEKLQNEFRKYKNENTPSGSLPPFLKPKIDIKKEKNNIENKPPKDNIRNARPKVDRKKRLSLKKCPDCGGLVHEERAKPRRRMVIRLELPQIENTEYFIPRYWCGNCHKEVSPQVPNALPNSKYDLTVALLISTMYVGMNLSYGKIAEFLHILGLNISKAAAYNIQLSLKEYLSDDYDQLKARIFAAKAKCKDETSWRHNGKLNWVWIATTLKDVCYWIESSRSSKTAREIFEGDRGIDTTDGYSAYDNIGKKTIQRDWSHMIRKWKNPSRLFNTTEETEDYKRIFGKVRKLYHNAKVELLEVGHSPQLREKYEVQLFDALLSSKYRNKNIDYVMNYIMHYNTDWFTFLEHEGVEPTSNRAERGLRHVVIKRKISQQTKSDESRQNYAMQVSLYMTSRLQEQNYFGYLKGVVDRSLMKR